MKTSHWLMGAAGVGAGTYAALVGNTWLRYGQGPRRVRGTRTGLDEFMPEYEVEERHSVRIAAPAYVAMAAAAELDLEESAVVRAIIRTRELFMGAQGTRPTLPPGLFRKSEALGWRMLADRPTEAIFGAVTQPWHANVVFRPLPPEEFEAFAEPGFAKIVWSIRVEPLGDGDCEFRTETRVVTTSPDARARFRRYWAFVSPGVRLIRWATLWEVKRAAERAWAQRPGQSLRREELRTPIS